MSPSRTSSTRTLPTESPPPRRKGLGWPAFVLALVTAGALGHVALRLHSLELAYDLARQRKVESALEEQRRRLHTEIGMLKDPHRVVALAGERLQMGPPAPEDIRRLRRGMSLAPFTATRAEASAGAGAGRASGLTRGGLNRPSSPGPKPAAEPKRAPVAGAGTPVAGPPSDLRTSASRRPSEKAPQGASAPENDIPGAPAAPAEAPPVPVKSPARAAAREPARAPAEETRP